jgi:hypothetical protein
VDVQSAISDILQARDNYSSYIDHPHPLEPAIATHYDALADADPAEVERVLSESVRRSDNPDSIMKKLLRGAQQTRAFSSSTFLYACARATQMLDDRTDWLFPRFFLSRSIGSTDDRSSHMVGVLLSKAIDEVRSAPAERRVDGVVRILECVPAAFEIEVRRDASRAIGTTGSLLSTIAECATLADEAKNCADIDRIWNALRGVNEMFRELVPNLSVLCGSDAAAKHLLELVRTNPPARAKTQLQKLRFSLHQRLREPDEMAAHIYDKSDFALWMATAAAYEAAGRAADAVALLTKLRPSVERDRELARLGGAIGGTTAALDHVVIRPDNVASIAKEYGVDVADIVALGSQRAKDKGDWIVFALTRREYDLAASLATGVFQPSALREILDAAPPSAPSEVMGKIAARAADLLLAPSTIWLDETTAKPTALYVVETALAHADADNERVKLRTSLRKKAQKVIAKGAYFEREIAISIDDALGD